jgi:hypothetical protein
MSETTEEGIRHWIFSARQEEYDLGKDLKVSDLSRWLTTTHQQQINNEDIVWFWQSGSKGGIYGWGIIEDKKAIDDSKICDVNVICSEITQQRLDIRTIADGEVLNRLSIFTLSKVTNSAVTTDQALALIDLFSSYGKTPPPPTIYSQLDVKLAKEASEKLVIPKIEARYFFHYLEKKSQLQQNVLQTVDILWFIKDSANYPMKSESIDI